MDAAIKTLELDVAALGNLIQARFEANLGVSGCVWEARHAAQSELTRLRKQRDALADAELQAAWRDVLMHGGM